MQQQRKFRFLRKCADTQKQPGPSLYTGEAGCVRILSDPAEQARCLCNQESNGNGYAQRYNG